MSCSSRNTEYDGYLVKVSKNNRCKGGMQILDQLRLRLFLSLGKEGSTVIFKDTEGNTLNMCTITRFRSITDPYSHPICSNCAIGRIIPRKFCNHFNCFRGVYLTDVNDLMEDL